MSDGSIDTTCARSPGNSGTNEEAETDSGSHGAAGLTPTDTGVAPALSALQRGKMAVLADDTSAECLGHLLMAAERADADSVGFFVSNTSGILCAALPADRFEELRIPVLAPRNQPASASVFGASLNATAAHGVATGVSTGDRARTLRTLADPLSKPEDFSLPGHVFPLRADQPGVLKKPGRAEAAVDLCRLAGESPVVVVSTVTDTDGSTLTSYEALEQYCAAFDLPLVTIKELVWHRLVTEPLIDRKTETPLPAVSGSWKVIGYEGKLDGADHVALIRGTPAHHQPLVWIHEECIIGDVFGSPVCSCGEMLQEAMTLIGQEEHGVIVYLRQAAGSTQVLLEEHHGTSNEDLGLGDRSRAEAIAIAAQILRDVGVTRVQLLPDSSVQAIDLAPHAITVTSEATPNL